MTRLSAIDAGSRLSRPQGYHTRVVEELVVPPLVVIEYVLIHRYCKTCKSSRPG